MTNKIPDELVQAAAEAFDAYTESHYGYVIRDTNDPSGPMRAALQAAFAKLPECEEAINPFDPRKDLGEWNGWNACLITIVRAFRQEK